MTPNRDKTLLPITCGVILVHIGAMAASFFISPSLPPPPPPQKLLVKTISLKPSAPVQRVKEEPLVAQSEPAPEPAPTPPAQPTTPEPVKPPEPETPKPQPEPEPAPVVEAQTPEPIKAPEPMPEPPKPEPEPAPAVTPKPKAVAQQTKPKPKKTPEKKETPKKPVAKKETKKKTPVAEKKPEVKKAETPVAKKSAPKPAAPSGIVKEKKPAAPSGPTAEELAAQKKQQSLIAQAKENIAKIGQSRDKGAVITTPGLPEGPSIGRLESLHIDALPTDTGVNFTPQESNYRDELASRLKLLLSLPEYGEVQIKLTLDRNGKVVKVEVVKAENAANRKHVESKLPKYNFPPFGNNFGNAETNTFLIKLRNE